MRAGYGFQDSKRKKSLPRILILLCTPSLPYSHCSILRCRKASLITMPSGPSSNFISNELDISTVRPDCTTNLVWHLWCSTCGVTPGFRHPVIATCT